MKKDFNCLCYVSVEEWYELKRYFAGISSPYQVPRTKKSTLCVFIYIIYVSPSFFILMPCWYEPLVEYMDGNISFRV